MKTKEEKDTKRNYLVLTVGHRGVVENYEVKRDTSVNELVEALQAPFIKHLVEVEGYTEEDIQEWKMGEGGVAEDTNQGSVYWFVQIHDELNYELYPLQNIK